MHAARAAVVLLASDRLTIRDRGFALAVFPRCRHQSSAQDPMILMRRVISYYLVLLFIIPPNSLLVIGRDVHLVAPHNFAES